MRYYTKDFYALLDQCDYLSSLKITEETDFDQLYQLSLENYIQEARKIFNTPLFSVDENFHSEDTMANKYSNMISEIFANRGSFNEQKVKEEFEYYYLKRLAQLNYPKEITGLIDTRILALGYCNNLVYTILKSMQNKNQLSIRNIINEEEKARDQSLKNLYDLFDFVEGILIQMDIQDSHIYLRIDGFYLKCDMTINLRFTGAKILENEITEVYDCAIKKVEFYRNDGFIETHMIIFNGQYRYLTIQAVSLTANEFFFK